MPGPPPGLQGLEFALQACRSRTGQITPLQRHCHSQVQGLRLYLQDLGSWRTTAVPWGADGSRRPEALSQGTAGGPAERLQTLHGKHARRLADTEAQGRALRRRGEGARGGGGTGAR